MSRILFVVPVFKVSVRQECRGTLLLATILKEKGMDVDIYRYFEAEPDAGFNSFLERSVNDILAKEPSVVSFYCRGDCYLANIMIAKKLKERRDDLHIVFGGPQADVSAVDTIKQIPWVDYCCSGEGETTIYPLFSALLAGKDVTSVEGLTYRDSMGNTVSNPRPRLISDLDTLPFIDYSLLSAEQIQKIKDTTPPMLMDVGRGCPYNCAYCSTSLFWQRKFRLKSPERIINEIKHHHENFGTTSFVFDHDLFTANKKQVIEFCSKLKENNLDINWVCSSRADTIDKELIDIMVSAGMNMIYLGIESGSARMQNIIHKKLNIEKAKEIIKYLCDKGVKSTLSFIYGFPEETYDDLEETLQMIYELKGYGIHTFQLHLCSIFPGTEYYEKYKDQMVWADNFSDIAGSFGVEENMDFVREHKELFPFYYEYRSELRSRLNGMNKTIFLFMDAHRELLKLDADTFAGKSLVDLYLNFKDANKDILTDDISKKECIERKSELITNYISSIYNEENALKVKEYFAFINDLQIIKQNKADTTDVKIYNIDINAVLKGLPLKDIKKRTSMVYITLVNNKTSCGVQYLD